MEKISGRFGETGKGGLSILSRLLTLWILLAMAGGIILGAAYPQIAGILDAVRIEQVSLPIAIGLIWMMYPPLAGLFHYNVRPVVRYVIQAWFFI